MFNDFIEDDPEAKLGDLLFEEVDESQLEMKLALLDDEDAGNFVLALEEVGLVIINK